MALVTFQVDILQKKAQRAEEELREMKDKYERERQKNEQLNMKKTFFKG